MALIGRGFVAYHYKISTTLNIEEAREGGRGRDEDWN